MAYFGVSSERGFDMQMSNLVDYRKAEVIELGRVIRLWNERADGTHEQLLLVGEGFTANPDGSPTGAGTVLRLHYAAGDNEDNSPDGYGSMFINELSLPLTTFLQSAGSGLDLLQSLMSGSDAISGNFAPDRLWGYVGDDTIYGWHGGDTIFGGSGDDVIYAGEKVSFEAGNDQTFLRGEEGDDQIRGGAGFDDLHGNQGNDTLYGGSGDDWVVGGKDDDLLHGESGSDIVYGNLGKDTCLGGEGADLIRGGQGDDVIFGGAGDDRIWGDRGNDTVTGGSGADTFNVHGEMGIDRVLDFNAAEGDRVKVESGTYTIRTAGSDTLLDFGGGNELVLVGIPNFQTGWIV